ncbi:MAG: zinc ribbon domain-containing protein [Chloroflexi bacterium]|nr:zinc ribbon domain-containing protein [Chloroflexota bacterium]
MTDAAGKACPRCGHTNKLTAKNCTQCGAPFYLADVQGEMRKRCAACGHFNRLTANVCTRCGAAYAKVQIAARGHKQKWCPQCGAPRRMTAKACSRCGYRFVIRPAEAPSSNPINCLSRRKSSRRRILMANPPLTSRPTNCAKSALVSVNLLIPSCAPCRTC